MPCILVTGANRGIGLEFVRQYAADGWRVHAACRAPGDAHDLNRVEGDVTVHALDVADGAARAALADSLSGEPLDILLNNAGIWGGPQNLDDLDFGAWARAFQVNTLGPMALARDFLPHVEAGEGKRLVFITSQLGSIGDNGSGGYYPYRSSKAALNAAVRSLAHDVADNDIIALLLHPGWVRTNMGGPHARLDPETSVRNMRAMIAAATPSDSGRFMAHDAREFPW